MIPYGRQDINQHDIDAVEEVLRSDWLTQGPMVPRFEQAVVDYCSAKYGVAVNSATSALHLACLALGLGKGDVLWTSPNTFVASANCALYCGASVDFVDIDMGTYNLCPLALEIKLEKAERLGRLPKVVVAVHFAGHSCDMRRIKELSKKYHFYVIEDASHAIGGEYLGNKIGGGQYSDITVFSFHPVKIITAAEGGMALTNSEEWAQKMALLRGHGITRDPNLLSDQTKGAWYYEQIDLGFNYRMSDIHAALGLSQLKRLDEFVEKRQFLVGRYAVLLSDLGVTLPQEKKGFKSAWHLYVIRVSLLNRPCFRDEVFESMREMGANVNIHYIPIYRHLYHTQALGPIEFPNVEKYYSQALTLPLYPTLACEDQDKVAEFLSSCLN